MDTITGTIGNDYFDRRAQVAGEVLDMLAGDDTVFGGGGNDLVLGGDGTDNLGGNAGDDTIRGDRGTDYLFGGYGNDSLEGGADGDYLYGGDDLGADTLVGGAGADTLVGAGGVDLLKGDGGNDSLSGGAEADTLLGGAGHDTLRGEGGDDLLDGGDGNDVLQGGFGTGADRFVGGRGRDLVTYEFAGASITVDLTAGVGSGGDAAGDTYDAIEDIRGGSAGDTLRGDGAANAIAGGAGGDLLTGMGGADRFVFSALGDSSPASGRDTIADFSQAQRDRIDLSAVDAVAGTPGDDGFRFLGATTFTGGAGELVAATVGGTTVVSGDVDGDRVADIQIVLQGLIGLTGADFVL